MGKLRRGFKSFKSAGLDFRIYSQCLSLTYPTCGPTFCVFLPELLKKIKNEDINLNCRKWFIEKFFLAHEQGNKLNTTDFWPCYYFRYETLGMGGPTNGHNVLDEDCNSSTKA